MTTKGQITVPKQVRELLHLKAGDELEFVVRPREGVLLHKYVPAERFRKYAGDLEELRDLDIDEFMNEIRGR
jgi:AbrB family looped-hinge helix DNA binding protein